MRKKKNKKKEKKRRKRARVSVLERKKGEKYHIPWYLLGRTKKDI